MNRATPEINFLDESRHAKMMAELDRLIRLIFDEEMETNAKGVKSNGK